MKILSFLLFIPWLVFSFMTLMSFKPNQQPLLYFLLLLFPLTFKYARNGMKEGGVKRFLPLVVFVVLMLVFGKLI